MEKFLSQHMNLPLVDRQIIKDVIAHYTQWQTDNKDRFCEICDIELTTENRKLATPHDFLTVCLQHEEYANFFRADIIRKELGIKPKEYLNDL